MPSRSREHRKQQEVRDSWARFRDSNWHPSITDRPIGSGIQRIRLVRLPSFESASFWEVSVLDSVWVLYSAAVISPNTSDLIVRGYERVAFDSNALKNYFDRLVALALPIAPDLSMMGGADGEITQLTLIGDMSSEVSFQWWSSYPHGWSPLVELVNEILEAFRGQPDRVK